MDNSYFLEILNDFYMLRFIMVTIYAQHNFLLIYMYLQKINNL